MSGDAQLARREYLATAALIGVDATLKKPFRPEALLHVLQGFARRSDGDI